MCCSNNHKTQKRESFKNVQSEVVTNRRIKQEIRERTRNSGQFCQLVWGIVWEQGMLKMGKVINISTNKCWVGIIQKGKKYVYENVII
jgi:hypothetical protein